jgi:hypothetical protein
MRFLFLYFLLFSLGCSHQLKSKHIVGNYQFKYGKDFMALKNCVFSIDENLRFTPCVSITDFWSKPIAPSLSSELYNEYNLSFLESEYNLKYEGDFKKFMIAEFDNNMKERGFFIQGAINNNAYEFKNPIKGSRKTYANWRIYKKNGRKYILQCIYERDDDSGSTIFFERPLIKVK